MFDRLTHVSCWVHQVVVLSATFTNQPWEGPSTEKKKQKKNTIHLKQLPSNFIATSSLPVLLNIISNLLPQRCESAKMQQERFFL